MVIIDESEKLFTYKSSQLFSFLTIDNKNVHNCLHIKVNNLYLRVMVVAVGTV